MKTLQTIFLFLLSTTTLLASKVEKKELLERLIEPKVSVESSYLDRASIANGGGVSVAKNGIRINNEIISLSYTSWSFDWDNIAALPFGDGVNKPIEQMHSIRLATTLPYKIDDKWFLLTQITLSSTYEKELSDSYGVGFFSFASYKLDQDHTFQMGGFVNYHPTRTFGLPVVSYSYRSRTSDGFQFVFGFPRTYVGYHYNEDLLFRFGVLFSQSLIRLSDTSVMEAQGFIEIKDYMSSAGVAYDLNSSFCLESDLLYTLKREMNLFNKDGSKLQTEKVKPSFGVNLRLRYRF